MSKMFLRVAFISITVSALVTCGMVFTGCLNPPAQTVTIDLDGDGSVDALAVDEDNDGLPDIDETGAPIIVAGSSGYKIAGTVDEVGPGILTSLGALLGVPILFGVGAAWKGGKWGRLTMNLIMSIQAARKKLKKAGSEDALEIFDEVMTSKSSTAVKDLVNSIKKKKDVTSVTDST